MTLNETQITKIKEYAELQMTPRDIALILGLDVVAFEEAAATEFTPAWEALQAGYATAELSLRQAMYRQAKSGSTTAMEIYTGYLRERRQYELHYRHRARFKK